MKVSTQAKVPLLEINICHRLIFIMKKKFIDHNDKLHFFIMKFVLKTFSARRQFEFLFVR